MEDRPRSGVFTAINSRKAQEALGDLVSHPVYNLWVFDGPDNPVVLRARAEGNQVISYWTTQTAFPLFCRALAGLYNTRCGYQGTAPWAYQDYPDSRLYTEPAHAVAYPDEAGLPIPTLRWEALRDGIDDVRYLQALGRAIAAAEARLTRADPPTGLAAPLDRARQLRQHPGRNAVSCIAAARTNRPTRGSNNTQVLDVAWFEVVGCGLDGARFFGNDRPRFPPPRERKP